MASQPGYAANLQNPIRPKLGDSDVQALREIEQSLQTPSAGAFGMRDLKWTLEFRARRGKNGKDQHVKQCYIPASRIQDFITGVQSGTEGTQCVFRETKENHKRPECARDGARTALDFGR